jgi:hypothetical protein
MSCRRCLREMFDMDTQWPSRAGIFGSDGSDEAAGVHRLTLPATDVGLVNYATASNSPT